MKLGIPEISAEVSLLIPTYTHLYLFIILVYHRGYPWISHYKNLILAYPKTTSLSRLIPGYPGISHVSGYSGISLYMSGYGRVSLFHILPPFVYQFYTYAHYPHIPGVQVNLFWKGLELEGYNVWIVEMLSMQW